MHYLARCGPDLGHLMAFAVEPFSGWRTLAPVILEALTHSQRELTHSQRELTHSQESARSAAVPLLRHVEAPDETP
jgi:hypothetical protein